ncbi:MAG: hypothetical protein MJ189_04275 [Coriobacteriales bacterium]|nr:hypothetical protein [Coriobacteriales bacterium]
MGSLESFDLLADNLDVAMSFLTGVNPVDGVRVEAKMNCDFNRIKNETIW